VAKAFSIGIEDVSYYANLFVPSYDGLLFKINVVVILEEV